MILNGCFQDTLFQYVAIVVLFAPGHEFVFHLLVI